MKRRGVVGAVVAGLLLVLAGCQGSTPEQGGGGGQQGRGPITFAIGKDTSGAIPKMVEQWNQQHPDEQVRLQELPEAADQQRQQFVTALQARDSSYDVLGLDVIWTAEFAEEGWIVELNKADFPQDQYLPGPYESASYEGKLYAAPWNTNGGLLYYRKDILDKEGLQPPKTWEELAEMARTLTEKHGLEAGYVGQLAKYEGLTVNAMELVWAAGGNALEGSNVTFDSPEARKALEWLAQGVREGWIPEAALTMKEEESRRFFQAGEALFMRNWPYVYGLAKKDKNIADKFDVAPLPGFEGGTSATAVGGYNLAISAFSTKQQTALDFIKFMTSPEQMRFRLLEASEVPSLKALYDDPEAQEKLPYLPVMKEALATSRSRPVTPFYNDVSLAIQDHVYEVLQGRKTPDQAVSELAGALRDIVGQS